MNQGTNIINSAKNLVNHITFVLDESGSMQPLTQGVIDLFDKQVGSLVEMSQKNGQETRVSVFKFNAGWFGNNVECLVYDTDVLRVPSIKAMYTPNGGTPLIEGVTVTINDLKAIPEKYGDHAHLMFIITDGEENRNGNAKSLNKLITTLPQNWTLGCLVPNSTCMELAVSYGIPAENCMIWEQTKAGIDKVNKVFTQTTKTFMDCRSRGIKKMTGSMFKVDLSEVKVEEVKKNLEFISRFFYVIHSVKADIPIKECVEKELKLPFKKGSGFYELTKAEDVQDYKEVCVRDTRNGNVYTGVNARSLIGLPTSGTIKVKPEGSGIYEIFIQSTSLNRKLQKGTRFLYLK